MRIINNRPLTGYIEAFARYSSNVSGHFSTREFGSHALVKEGEQVYQVSHFYDLATQYESYFDGSTTLVYTELPIGLWIAMLGKQNYQSQEDLIIDLYQAWYHYWKLQENWYRSATNYSEDKARSYKDFTVLATKMPLCPQKMIEEAEALNGIVFIPIIAMALRKQYVSSQQFYMDCVRIMVNQYHDHFGNGETFVRVGPPPGPGADEVTYFIYSVDENY